VSSRDESIDPVGACVGLKGSRVRAVVQELGGERIDIVPWHPDPEIFAKRALAPARVAKVISDYEARTMTAIVDEDQLSLAIGRNGQNVRLASQLIGWQLDLYGSREWLEHGAERALFGGGGEGDEDSQDFPLSDLELPPATLAALQAAGYNTFFDIIDLERDDLLRIPAIGAADADRIAALIEDMTVEEDDGEAGQQPGAPADAAALAAGEGDGADAGAAEDGETNDGARDDGETDDGEAAAGTEGLTRGGGAENLAFSD
jgi:transcription termination/antitermination protein NusA